MYSHRSNVWSYSKVGEMYSRAQLRQAVHGDEFTLVFQPIFKFKTGKFTGAEALLRWNVQDAPQIGPEDFIPDAENNGGIVELGEWVVSRAVQEAAQWPSYAWLAVNASGRELQRRGYGRMVIDCCTDAGFSPARLQVEVTESDFDVTGPVAQANLRSLREGGALIAIDDFGSGSSDERRLAELDADVIKIDRSRVAQISSPRAQDREELNKWMDAALKADRQIIAEGVETKLQETWLIARGAELGQGYLYSRPIPVGEFVEGFLPP